MRSTQPTNPCQAQRDPTNMPHQSPIAKIPCVLYSGSVHHREVYVPLPQAILSWVEPQSYLSSLRLVGTENLEPICNFGRREQQVISPRNNKIFRPRRPERCQRS